jgi:hypothetical protein
MRGRVSAAARVLRRANLGIVVRSRRNLESADRARLRRHLAGPDLPGDMAPVAATFCRRGNRRQPVSSPIRHTFRQWSLRSTRSISRSQRSACCCGHYGRKASGAATSCSCRTHRRGSTRSASDYRSCTGNPNDGPKLKNSLGPNSWFIWDAAHAGETVMRWRV